MATNTIVLGYLTSLFSNNKIKNVCTKTVHKIHNSKWIPKVPLAWTHTHTLKTSSRALIPERTTLPACFVNACLFLHSPRYKLWYFLDLNTPLCTCTRKLIKWIRQKSWLCLGQQQTPALLPPAPVCRGKKHNCELYHYNETISLMKEQNIKNYYLTKHSTYNMPTQKFHTTIFVTHKSTP
jgi:hypothetical protein